MTIVFQILNMPCMLETLIGDENINLTNASRRKCLNPPMCVNVMCSRCTAMFNRFAGMCVQCKS